MIRIILLGRTGNNLFQYALGRTLAKKHGVPLVLDASWFNSEGWQEVSHFLKLPIHAKVVRDPSPFSRALLKLTGRHRWSYGNFPFLIENPDDHSFDTMFLQAPADCALFGYFQSWRYFKEIENELRAEMAQLLETSSGQNAHSKVARASCMLPILEKISGPESVAVHVRRGDFLNHPAFQVCDITYYRNAMNEMREHLGSPKFFIFSDDPKWCRREMTGVDIEVIDSGKSAANPIHDLYLMSLASHHIIANSSYSWWAAWIGKKPGQTVILPERWFANQIHAPIGDKNAW